MTNLKDLCRDDIEYLITQWIHNERDRHILMRRMCDGISFDSLAEEFDLSVQWVKTIVYQGKEKIYLHVDKIQPK